MSRLLSTSDFRIPLTGRTAWHRYLVSIAAVVLAFCGRTVLEVYWPDQFSNFAFFYIAVMISAWYGGLFPGLFTMVMAAIVAIYNLPVAGSFQIQRSIDSMHLGLFVLNASIICVLIENLHRSLIRQNFTAGELVGSQKRIRSILESVQGCFLSLDEEGRIVHINEDCDHYVSGDYRRLVGKTVWEAFPAWQGTEFENRLILARDSKLTERFEFYDANARRFHEVHFSPTIEGMSVHFYDFTARKRAEQDLIESESRFRRMADQAPVMIWTTDEKGSRNYVNQPWLTFRNRPLEQELGVGWEEGIHPADRAAALKIFQDAFAERRSFRKEYRWKRFDGVYRWMVSSGVPRFDPDGKFVGYIGSAMDITETRRTQKEREAFLLRHNEVLVSLAKRQEFAGADFDERIAEVAQAAVHGLDVSRSSIWFYSRDRSVLRCADLFDRDKNHHGKLADLNVADYPSYFDSLEKFRIIAAEDALSDPRTREFRESYLKPAGIVSTLDAPIRLHGKTIGALCNEAIGDTRAWTLEEQAFAASLADMVALSVGERERKHRERRQATEYAITQVLSVDPLLSAAIPNVLQTVCEGLGWELGAFWEIPDGKSLRCCEVWARDPEKFSGFIQATLSERLGAGEGFPGRAWMSGRSMWFEDIACEAQFPRREVALQENLVSAVVFPVHFGGELLGVFEFYSNSRQESDKRLLQMFEVVGSEIGQFMERKRAEGDLRLSQQHLSLALQAAKMGYWSWDLKSNSLISSENLEFFHGRKGDFGGNLKDFLASVHSEDRETVWRTLEDAMNKRQDYHVEFRTVWPDQSIHWISARGQIFYDEDREPDQMIGLGIDITEVKKSQESLEAINSQLEKRVEERTAELARANSKLQAEIRERQKVEREALEIVQKEQKRFAAQLHDGLCQSLAGTMMLAKASVQKLERQKIQEVGELKNVIDLISQSVNEARDLARGLFPVELEANSLMLSLKGLAARSEQIFKVAFEFHCPVPILVGDNVTATHLYRIAQEAINNAVHHGKAKKIKLSLLEKDNRLLLQVVDDGEGLSQDLNFSAGVGLHIMRYRARMMDAELRFEAGADGTTFTCEVPIPLEGFAVAQ